MTLKSVKVGDTIFLAEDLTRYHILKIEKGYDAGWKRMTYVEDIDDEHCEEFHKTFSAPASASATLIRS